MKSWIPWIVAAVIGIGCGSSPARSSPPAAKSCDDNPEVVKGSHSALACARELMGRGEYDTADSLTKNVMANYPYSKVAVEAEELHGDILFAKKDYVNAYRAYADWLRLRPSHERTEAVTKKRDEADKLSQPAP